MPTYTFFNKKTKKVVATEMMTIAEMEKKLKDNPELDLAVAAPLIGDNFRMGRVKLDPTFKNRLKEIKKSHYGSTINIRD